MRRNGRVCVLGAILVGFAAQAAPAQTAAAPDPAAPVLSDDLRRNGPPTDRPADDAGPPPATGVFLVPGEYHPEAGKAVWHPGFWARSQPGWSWLTARWTREPDGTWSFADGRWIRSRGTTTARTRPADTDDLPATTDDGTPLATALAPRADPVSLAASYLGNPNLAWGWGGFPYGGFYAAGPSYWVGGSGFYPFGAVTGYYNPGFALGFPYGGWGGWGGGGFGWGGFGWGW